MMMSTQFDSHRRNPRDLPGWFNSPGKANMFMKIQQVSEESGEFREFARKFKCLKINKLFSGRSATGELTGGKIKMKFEAGMLLKTHAAGR